MFRSQLDALTLSLLAMGIVTLETLQPGTGARTVEYQRRRDRHAVAVATATGTNPVLKFIEHIPAAAVAQVKEHAFAFSCYGVR